MCVQTTLDLKPLADGRREWNEAFPLYKKSGGRLNVTKKRGQGR